MAELALARAKVADDAATIARQNTWRSSRSNARSTGPRSERTAGLLGQIECDLEEPEAVATEDERTAEQDDAKMSRYFDRHQRQY